MFGKIQILFFENPGKRFSVRETARKTGLSPATASKKLKELKKQGFIKHEKIGIYDFYKADMETNTYKDAKTYYNIRKIRESNILEALSEFYVKPTIILFGSQAKGEDIEESDIDLAIISENTKEFPNQEFYEKKLGKQIQILAARKLSDLKNEHLINNVLNGIILQGELEWI